MRRRSRAETALLAAFDEWRNSGAASDTPAMAAFGTFVG
jgi:hypothetical protein